MDCFLLRRRQCNYHCKIVLLDETELIQEIHENSRGQDVLDVVVKHLNLLETAYFGLRYINDKKQPIWLDSSKRVMKQLNYSNPITLYFCVKFYASDPCKLLEEITRYQFFLQIKQDILQSRLPVPFELASELLAYIVQSELGDYDCRQHQTGYISEFRLLPNQSIELESKAHDLHKKLVGQVPATAEMNFLDRVKWLDLYGADLHPVLGEDNVEYFIGLTPSGVIVLRNKSKVGNYFWTRILKIIRKGKYFMIKVIDKNNEEKTYGFELVNKSASKQIWKCCTEHQNFFKLTQNTLQIDTKPGLSQKFKTSSTLSKGFQENVIERPPPMVVRVPSRRYQRRMGQPDGADAGAIDKDEAYKENGYIEVKSSILMPAINRHNSSSAIHKPPYSGFGDTQSLISAPYHYKSERGLFSRDTNPSPRSVRSASHINRQFLDHNANSYSRVRSNSSSNVSRSRNSRFSDNESEVSKCSRSSRQSRQSRHSQHSQHRCRHRNKSEDSGTESDSSRKRRHRRKHKYYNGNNYSDKLVDTESQWRDLQQKQQQMNGLNGQIDDRSLRPNGPQSAVVRHVSGYVNSGLESDAETTTHHSTLNRNKNKEIRRSRSKSPDVNRRDRLPPEMKKHFEYQLVDPMSLTENERKDIKYTKIETDSRLFKIRYSPNGSRHRYRLESVPVVENDSLKKQPKTQLWDNYVRNSGNYGDNYNLLNGFNGVHKSQDSNASVSSSHVSNSSKLDGSDSTGSGQMFSLNGNNYSSQPPPNNPLNHQNYQNNYNSYDIYRPTAMTRSTSEFKPYSHFDYYYNDFNRNKNNESYHNSYNSNAKSDRIIEDNCHINQSSAPRVTFQTPPTTTYYPNDIHKLNIDNTYTNKSNGNAYRVNYPLQPHEMSTEL
ncbi:band 4.1-like protein 4 [Oppia nitens]|uniref:band 4.1-like protein 4 n=1 Tax=Oppia nitens TaxID=1686743 RepID=UPI0023D9FC98|nr:band 4.1-like protein 4 [Oppia nitens]